MSLRRLFDLGLTLSVMFALVAGTSTSAASSKFAYTEEVAAAGDLVVRFDEMTLKRFDVVDYQLDATADALSTSACGTQQILQRLFPTTTVSLTPDAKGRVEGTLTLDLDVPLLIPCQVLRRIDYTNVTLTNFTTGHVYRLDPISRDF